MGASLLGASLEKLFTTELGKPHDEGRRTKPKPNDAHGAGATRAVGSPCAAAARGVGLSVPATTTSPLRPLWVKNASTEF